MDLHTGRALTRDEIAQLLAEARARTLLLVAPLDADELRVQHDPLMSPIVWDLGHIAHFEEVWLLEKLEGGGDAGSEGLRGIYDPFENPRSVRDRLELPSPAEALDFMARVRRDVLARLDELERLDEIERLDADRLGEPARLDPPDGDAPGRLLEDGFVFRMVLQHEYQHGETILQTLQLKKGRPYPAPRGVAPPAPGTDPDLDATVRFPGGRVAVGTDDRSAAYDNERPRHTVELEPFRMDVFPVTNGAYRSFVEDGGYALEEVWTETGWAWRVEQDLHAPKHWERRDGRWFTRGMDRERPLDPRRPVCHVCFHEAEAYARWAGKRLPTEAEWEVAAGWDPDTGRTLPYPWGSSPASQRRANVDQLSFGTAPVGSYPRNVSPLGCYGMIGDVWEWTSTDFGGYPGFESFPYREYSEAFFGSDFKVLRGGSWATRSGAIRTTFRNWDYPVRRQIFSGLRCAADG